MKTTDVALALCVWATACVALDVNQATVAELDGVRGIGPGLSSRILDARRDAPFHDWQDLIQRVPGIGPRAAAKLSAEGLDVSGQVFLPSPAGAAEKPARSRPPAAAPTASGAATSAVDAAP